ncbi:GUN4 domain-containing protein [Phormidium nigroviride]
MIGLGGYGITYKATHLQLNHQVVIKTPNGTLQNDPEYPKYVKRFIKEGQTLAKLSQNAHPNIVRVSDLFEENGIHCLVMDLVYGESLFNMIRQQGRLPDTEAVAIIRQIGEALIDVHQAGIVHRDAHPGNIMLRRNGQAVLIDFGIASDLIPTVINTNTHPCNPAFAPWEQHIEGSGKPTVDIYALAASLYYAVTGERPTPSLQRQFQKATLKPAKDFGVKDWVSLAIEKGMASDPTKRPQSMKDWLGYLREPIPQTIANVSVQLKSARGVDYTNLWDLLAAGKWKEADRETHKVMLKAARREKEGYFTKESIDNFPCEDLRTIDQLWVKYSQGRFGFSVQKKIWLECGGKVDDKTEKLLADRVGWRKEGSWLNYDDLNFSKQAQEGHLPWGLLGLYVLDRFLWFFSRIENCKL